MFEENGASLAKIWSMVHMIEPNIPALAKELRKLLHLTQEQFARKVGVTYPTRGSTAWRPPDDPRPPAQGTIHGEQLYR